MSRLGKLFFQCNGKEDVFLSVDVRGDGIVSTYESINSIQPLQFDGDKAWINGEMPQRHAVSIDADTGMLHCWFNGEEFTSAFTIKIYLELEMVEELVSESEIQAIEERGRKAGDCDYNDKCLLEFENNPDCKDTY